MELRQAQIRLFSKFAHLYDSGVPLAEALDLARTDLGEPVESAVGQVVEDLYRGTSLSDAMERRPDAFSPDVVGIFRSGEKRGELGAAARNAATGLGENFLEPRRVEQAELDGLLESAGDAHFLHLEPTGRLRIRTMAGLSDGGEVDSHALAAALGQRIGLDGPTGTGAFVWRNRLVRVAMTGTPNGPATVVRLSREPGPEPEEARAWRTGRPGLLLVLGDRHADKDSCLRSILGAFDAGRTKRVAIDLPAPEALPAPDIDAAMAQDPDVLCLTQLLYLDTAQRLKGAVAQGVWVVVGCASDHYFGDTPHRTVRL